MRLFRSIIRFTYTCGLLFLVLCWFSPSQTVAQRVALVLSGGGSKGAAHIGVIRALEEQHIPIDYIAGTSIGAVVGALYAMGYTPDEMEALMTSPEFNRWANGISESEYQLYFRKEPPNASWVSFDFSFKKKLTAILPANLVSTDAIDFELMRLMAPASAACGYNFDSLMVPFRCVVSDIDSSRALVLRSGNLASAVRASMTIPFVLSPMEMNNRLLYDGGMYDNFPADVARESFHPDVIIGSRVAERFEKASADDALSQLLSMLMGRQNDTLTAPNSVLIAPSLPKTNLLDFSHAQEFIDSGYRATQASLNDIRKLIRNYRDPETLAAQRQRFTGKEKPLVFDSVFVTGLTRSQAEYVRHDLKHGQRLLPVTGLKRAYFRLLDEGFIKKIYPVAIYNPRTGYYDLHLRVQKSDNFNLQFGGNISFGTSNEAFLQLEYKYLWKDPLHVYANGYFGRFYNSVRTGGRIDFSSKLPWTLALSYTYNNYNYFKNTTYFFDDQTPSYLIQLENFGELEGSIPVTPVGKVTGGITYSLTNSRYYQSNTFSRYDTADQTDFDFYAPRLLFDLNSLNPKQFAAAGARFKVGFTYFSGLEYTTPGSSSDNRTEIQDYHHWCRLRVLYDNYFQSLGPVKLGFYTEGVISSQPFFANYTATMLYAPQFQPLPEMQTLFLTPFRAMSWASVGLKAIVRIYKKIEFRAEGYFFQPYRQITENPTTGQAEAGPVFSAHSWLASGTFVYKTFLGPLSIGVNYYDHLPQPVTFNINFGYILFNPSSL